MLKIATLICIAVACLCSLALSAYGADEVRKRIDVPAGELAVALEALAKQTGVELIYKSEELAGIKTKGASGNLTAKEAVNMLLEGTPLTVRVDTSGAMLIGAPRASKEKQGSQSVPQTETVPLEGIIVTAQKRSERLQDVPVPVTQIDAQTLIDNNQLRLQDYYNTVPGLTIAQISFGGFQTLTIRGISTSIYSNPTVSITVDDVPYGSSNSSASNSGNSTPDIDPSDLARIEVLRGPQGTLYGANSIGGLVKFVTVDPSISSSSGRIEGSVSSVENGAKLGYGVRGAANVPLSDTLAIRVSGFARQDPGYIDNVVTNVAGANKADAYGGHLSALWQPTDAFSLKLGALLQEIKGDGSTASTVLPGLGDLQQNFVRGAGGYNRKIQAYSAILKAEFASFDLTAVSGYNINQNRDSYDLTTIYAALVQRAFGVSSESNYYTIQNNKFTEEIRLSSKLGGKFEWLVGGFYTHERAAFDVQLQGLNSAGTLAGVGSDTNSPSTYAEFAPFVNLTYHFTDRTDIQIGGRQSTIRQNFTSVMTGIPPFVSTPYYSTLPQQDIKASAFTYLLTPRFRVSPDLMVYARIASGYQAGGVNPNGYLIGVPTAYKPATTENYEIGAKANFLDNTLSVDASLYYIGWKDLQLTLINLQPLVAYYANGGAAKSEGLELSVESRPLKGLKIAGWIVLNNAVLTKPFPANSSTRGVPGDRLPYASRISSHVSLEQDFPIGQGVRGFLGGALSYVGDRLSEFVAGSPNRQHYPSYLQTNLRAGLKFDPWTLNLYCNNVGDKRGIISGGVGRYPPYAFYYITPRVIGMSVSRSF